MSKKRQNGSYRTNTKNVSNAVDYSKPLMVAGYVMVAFAVYGIISFVGDIFRWLG